MDMIKSPLDGISVIIGEEDVTNISATIEGPSELSQHSWLLWWAVYCYTTILAASCVTITMNILLLFSVEDTPYEGGVFKMKLVLGHDFPASPPQGVMLILGLCCDLFPYQCLFPQCVGFFVTKIFHPNVASNGAICVNTLKKDWKPDSGIKHILLVSWQQTSAFLIHKQNGVATETFW